MSKKLIGICKKGLFWRNSSKKIQWRHIWSWRVNSSFIAHKFQANCWLDENCFACRVPTGLDMYVWLGMTYPTYSDRPMQQGRMWDFPRLPFPLIESWKLPNKIQETDFTPVFLHSDLPNDSRVRYLDWEEFGKNLSQIRHWYWWVPRPARVFSLYIYIYIYI